MTAPMSGDFFMRDLEISANLIDGNSCRSAYYLTANKDIINFSIIELK